MSHFIVTLSLPEAVERPADASTIVVNVKVEADVHYGETVTLTYWCEGDTEPLFIDPTSDTVYCPKNGSVTTTVTVGLSSGQTVVLIALGTDGFAEASDSIELTG